MPPEPAAAPCAVASANRGESLAATASRVRKWMLVEQPGPWGDDALADSKLEADVAQALRTSARRVGVRVVLIRRPGWKSADVRRVYLARSDRVHRWVERIDVEDSGQLLEIDLEALDGDERPGTGAPGPAAVHLVCTNGKRDRCCADLGRPVVRALLDAGVDEVWESSHVGGDRFAANVVCLPTGVYFGRVPPADAARIVSEHAAGLLDLAHYRGRSCYPPMLQAAEIFARRELGERRLAVLRFLNVERDGDDTITADLTHVEQGILRVRIARERGAAERLTCNSDIASPPWQYRLLELSRVSSD